MLLEGLMSNYSNSVSHNNYHVFEKGHKTITYFSLVWRKHLNLEIHSGIVEP